MIKGDGPKSQSDFNTVEFLLNKQMDIPTRKNSQYNIQEFERPNFVLLHQAEEYEVVRVYINSLTSSQIRLYYSKFTPKTKQGTVCIIHGYGQTTDDYIEMAEYFAKNRFVVNMLDLRSFGYSGGNRVNQSIEGLLSDIQNLLRRCCSIGLPTYVIAHGFGSLLLFALLQQNPRLPLAGVISLSPLFAFPFFQDSTFIGKSMLWMLSSLWPDLLLNNMINPTSLTNNLQKVKGCIDGVFNYQFVTINMIQKYSQLSEKVLNDAYKFHYPLFILFGKKNTIQSIRDVKIFYNSVKSKERSSFLLEEGYHQLFKDVGAEQQVYCRVLQWILDDKSSKNDIRWSNTPSFNLKVIKQYPKALKYAILLIIPIIILVLKKIKRVNK